MSKRKHRTPTPKWLAEIDIKFERVEKSATSRKPINQISQINKTTEIPSKIKTVSIEAKCSCEGENSNCFKCSGTGFYKSRRVTNIEECQDRIQEKRTYQSDSIQELKFSNDQRGGIYGIRENGRYPSNPLHEEDI